MGTSTMLVEMDWLVTAVPAHSITLLCSLQVVVYKLFSLIIAGN